MERAPVFMLIHGGQVGGWVWESVRARLTAPSVAPDLPGHGADGGPLKGLRMAACIDAVIRQLPEHGRVILVGHSLGAAIALAVASQVRERIAHLVLIAGLIPKSGEPLVAAFPPAMRLISQLLLRLTPQFSQPRSAIKSKLLNGMPAAQADAAAARFAPESSALFFDPVHWSVDLKTPCTYVRCLRDRGPLSPDTQAQLALRLGPGAWVTGLEACHYAMLEQPDAVAELLNGIHAADGVSATPSADSVLTAEEIHALIGDQDSKPGLTLQPRGPL